METMRLNSKAWIVAMLAGVSLGVVGVVSEREAAAQSGGQESETLPPNSKCPRDRKLPSTITYAVLPLDGELGDASVSEAIDEFLKGSAVSKGINAIVIKFNGAGGLEAEVARLAQQIFKLRSRMPVIGVLGSCKGAAAELPLLCDYLMVVGQPKETLVLDWSPPADVPDAKIGENIEKHLSDLSKRPGERAYYVELTRGMLDPTRDLFLWRGPDGCAEAGGTAPTGSESFQMSEGSDTATGFTAAQLETAGLAIEVQGGMADIGKALGVKTWTEKTGVGERLVAEMHARHEKEIADEKTSLKAGFAAIKQARNLVGALIEAESIARETDPRRRQFTPSYTRSWGGNRWSYSTGGTYAWRKNCDTSTAAWNAVIQLYDAASTATAQAKQISESLAKSPLAASDPEAKQDIASLTSEVDALMVQSGMLTIKGQNARAQIAWLKQNYNNPVR